MHDLDRTLFETDEAEAFELTGEHEALEQQEMAELLGQLAQHESFESFEAPELQETLEMELASELLEVNSEAELERFLGKLLTTAVKGARSFARSDMGRALGGVLKQAAKKAVPIVGRAVGSAIAPGGGDVGARLASQAATIFGLELEGLSHEDREFEVARRFVRFASTAAQKAASASPSASPAAVVPTAVAAAAQQHAPGLLAPARGLRGRRGRSGRWVRRGHSIVIYGV